jgi:hypothetical protein
MTSQFKHFPTKPPVGSPLLNAYYILCNTHDAASSFLDIFNRDRKARNAKGAPTDEEQDLLRAMLTFTSSGLDSMVKQLVADCLVLVINADEGAAKMFRAFVETKISTKEGIDSKFLSQVLADDAPKNVMLQALVDHLRASSLQSKNELFKVGAYFNIPSAELCTDTKLLQNIFDARNQIAHEMDIDFTQSNRSRRPRAKQTMIDYTNELFRIAGVYLDKVASRTASKIASKK